MNSNPHNRHHQNHHSGQSTGQTTTQNLNRNRISAKGYRIQVLSINGENQSNPPQESLHVVNIGKGGFRFISEAKFELEDRVKVLLQFPDDRSQEVFGRICYSDIEENNTTAYGFSVIDGFYSLVSSSA